MNSSDQDWQKLTFPTGDQGFRSLIENAIDVIVVLDENGIFYYCSPSAERVLGYRLEDVVGRLTSEFVHPDDIFSVMTVLRNALQNPGMSQPPIEYRVRHRNGCWRLFEAVATNLLHDPAIRGVVVNCHDITDRKQVEEALWTANQHISNILESITDAFISVDREWQLTYLNQPAKQLLGQLPYELLQRSVWDVFPNLLGTRFEHEAYQANQRQVPVTFEEFYPFLQSWFEVRIFPYADGLSIFLVNITERHQSQAELLEMSTALGNAVEGIARLDLAGRFIALNRAYAEALGYEQTDMIGMEWAQVVHPADFSLIAAAHAQMLLDGKADVEVRAVRQDGSTFYQEVVMVATYDWYDQLIGHHCFTRDISERKLAEEALRQQADRERQMAGLAKLSASISHRIRQSLDLDEILNTTVSEVRQFLNADRVVIYRCENSTLRRVVAESVQHGYASILGLQMQENSFSDRYALYCRGQNLVVDDVLSFNTALTFQAFLQRWQVQAFLAVPILHDDALWGTLVAHQCAAPRHWEAFEVRLLEQLAIQVAIAIQQSDLYRQVQQLNANLELQVQERTTQLEQALHYEATLKRITDSVRDSLDEDQILQNAVQELALALDLQCCDTGIYDLEQQTSTLRYEAIRGSFASCKGQQYSMQAYPIWYKQIFEGKYFQFCQCVQVSPRPLAKQQAVLVCPIVDNQGALGDLWLYRRVDAVFTELEIRLVQQVTNQCAIAIRQARLYQATQAQVIALEELNQLKDDFLSTVSHELRTPMANMKMAIHMLKTVNSPERQHQYLSILQSECVREIELINDLLDLQRLEAASYTFSRAEINLQDCITRLIEPFLSRSQNRQQTLYVNLSPIDHPVLTDRPILERVIAELLNNACKYTPPGGEIRLTVEPVIPETSYSSYQINHCQIRFQVCNQAEIPKTELTRIFDKFYRVPNSDRWKQGGTGLGLALVRRLVTELGGTIEVESANGWTTFTITLNSPIP